MKVHAMYVEVEYDNGDYASRYSAHGIGASHDDAYENATEYMDSGDAIVYESWGEFDTIEDACVFIACECFHVDNVDDMDVDAAMRYTLGDRIQAGIYC